MATASVDQHSNWKGRFKENSDKMRTGSLFEVAVVLKGLTFLARKKALSFREKRMLDRAKFLLVSEIAEVEGKSRCRRRGAASTRRSTKTFETAAHKPVAEAGRLRVAPPTPSGLAA